ncbi:MULTISPECIES: ATP-binding protein [unclassified Streptomyces]|uniref:ATP-binding protein n=1 Tax=unclassified Streptomyces TaxID=2593676 RepID=UPI000BF61D24|nr:ATP-binding protein [Streptomyces sp. Ru87]PGH50163.1 hypothetical protein CRI70_13590 [Streptomyces sp. Ru87]
MHQTATQDQQSDATWQMKFAARARSVRLVRIQVKETLHGWGYAQDDIDRILLVVSELATNAVQHGCVSGRCFETALVSASDHCRVEVSDFSPRRPEAQSATAEDEHGRGLRLVAALAEQVGHEKRKPVGKTVWARLARTPVGPPGEPKTADSVGIPSSGATDKPSHCVR